MKRNTSYIFTNRKKHFSLLHRHFKITRFYPFLKNTAYNGALAIAIFIFIVIAFEYFFFNINTALNNVVINFSAWQVLSSFLISETFLGLVPPEIYIAWASKTASPWLFLFLLASMSYLGGIISYYIGNRLFLIPTVKTYIESKIFTHIRNLQKWGGILVFIGAMLPIPHSVVSLSCGLIKYNFKHYLLWALFRFLRFLIYAIIIFQLL